MKINKSFIDRVMYEGFVNTAKYRYIACDCGDHAKIKRLPIFSLGTTDAIDGWEVIAIIK